VPIVVMLRETHSDDVDLVVRAFVNGAVGLVSKDRGVDSLMKVLEVVRQGEAAIPRWVARAVVDALRFGPALMEQQAGLSPRQRQVLALVARGLTDRQIARQLNITAPTVRSHLEAIFEKTRTTNRTAAARWATQYLIEPDIIPAAS
jgi:DNA-binding NarL/FixJ family response regulator